jgi:FkbM family methyltransferase
MNYYSQIGQDRFFIENIINGAKGGQFLDVGAHDGIATSNTYALETQLDWGGVCIEANPALAKQCEINRPRSCVIQAAVWSEEKQVEFELPHSGNDFLSRIGGISHNENYFAADFREVETISMTAQPLSKILGTGELHFNYFSLDVEGAELEALRGIAWDRTSFDYIALEFGHRNDFLKEIAEYLSSKGYVLSRINDFDADFIPEKQ